MRSRETGSPIHALTSSAGVTSDEARATFCHAPDRPSFPSAAEFCACLAASTFRSLVTLTGANPARARSMLTKKSRGRAAPTSIDFGALCIIGAELPQLDPLDIALMPPPPPHPPAPHPPDILPPPKMPNGPASEMETSAIDTTIADRNFIMDSLLAVGQGLRRPTWTPR